MLKIGVAYLESLLLRALHWKTLIHCLPALSPSTHQQLRYHGERILDSFCKNNLKAALLVFKILFHIHVFVQHNSLDFMVLTTPNRSNKKKKKHQSQPPASCQGSYCCRDHSFRKGRGNERLVQICCSYC